MNETKNIEVNMINKNNETLKLNKKDNESCREMEDIRVIDSTKLVRCSEKVSEEKSDRINRINIETIETTH